MRTRESYKPSGIDRRVAEFHEKGRDRVMLELAKQYEPSKVIREYVTNSLDGREQGRLENIVVLVLPEQKRIVISDNGIGMTPEKLESLRHSIGYSDKAERVDMRGEKGLGILAFASAGTRLMAVSKSLGDLSPGYGYLELENKNDLKIMSGFGEVKPGEVDNFFYGAFPHGTRVIIDGVNPHFLDKIYTPANIRKMLSVLYTPAIRKGDVSILVGRKGKSGKMNYDEVEPIDFRGDLLLESVMNLEDKDKDGNPVKLKLEALLFFNPEGSTDKVKVYSKDVLVYDSLTELDEFLTNKFWGCGKLTGYINDQFSKLVLGRDGIDRQRRQFRTWLGSIINIEQEFSETVYDRLKKGPRQKEDGLVRKAWRSLEQVYRKLKPMYESPLLIRAGVTGEEKLVVGVPPKTGMPEEDKPKIPTRRTDKPNGVTGLTGGTFEEVPEGTPRARKERVAHKKNISMGFPVPSKFSDAEAHLRSKLEDKLGAPMIHINIGHDDYRERRSGKDDDFIRYVIDLCSKEIAFAEAKQAIQQRVVSEEEAT